ncbi:MAG: ATP-dependent protease, partial [Mesorhizobium sp.]
MQAGNAHYRLDTDLPSTVPIFPLEGALLLPGGRMPLNIFEPRYLEMVDEAIAGSRLIGVIQPSLDGARRADGEPELCNV